MNNKIKIHLLDTNQIIELPETKPFPINIGIVDVRDITKRSGTWTKTINIPGNAHNNMILNNYFNINIVDGTFNVNKVCRVKITNGDSTILPEGTLNILSIVKKENTLNTQTVDIEYQVQILDVQANFFKEISNKYLTDLVDLQLYDHKYTVGNILKGMGLNSDGTLNNINGHTYKDVWKYVFPWYDFPLPTYIMPLLYPGIFVKAYWDRIHGQNGMQYTWEAQDPDGDGNLDPDKDKTMFSKLIIPYSGDAKKLNALYIPPSNTIVGIENGMTFKDEFYTLSESLHYIYNVIIYQNPIGEYIMSPPHYVAVNEYTDPNGLKIKSSGEYTFKIKAEAKDNTSASWFAIGSTPNIDDDTDVFTSCRIEIFNQTTNTTMASFPILPNSNEILEYDGVYSDGMNAGTNTKLMYVNGDKIYFKGRHKIYKDEEKIMLSGNFDIEADIQISVNDEIRLHFIVDNNWNYENWFIENTNTIASPNDIYYYWHINNVKTEFIPHIEQGIPYNSNLKLYDFIPQKIKQSDLVKTICQMYNLYPVTSNKNDPNRIIYRSREDFYAEGNIVDWTDKVDISKKQEIKLLPELTSKTLFLKYKDNTKDELLESYQFNTGKNYAEQKIIFDNENIKNEESKELIFSPTFNVPNALNKLAPWFSINYIDDKGVPRILIDNNLTPSGAYGIGNVQGPDTTGVQYFNTFSMFDKPYQYYDKFSIEFAPADYYPYDNHITYDNLYYRYWSDYMHQINNNKMLIVYVWLNDIDIENIQLNDTILIKDKKYYINRIIDYQPGGRESTKVELLTVE